jgi:hypothetical protein
MNRADGSARFRKGLLITCLATTLLLTGCSFLFVQPPRESDDFRSAFGCTTITAAPVLDTIFTLVSVGSAVYVASEDNVTNKGRTVNGSLLVGALWLSSAIYGYYYTSQCAELKRTRDDGPYRGPVHTVRPNWRARPVAPTIEPPPPPPPPPPPAAAPPAEAAPEGAVPPAVAPARPVVPQHMDDDDDPGRRRPPAGTGAYRAPAQ